MAIEIAFNTKFGDAYAGAYARIVNISLDYVNQRANVQVGIYKSSLARTEGKLPVEIDSYVYQGEEFEKIFAEVSVEKVGDTINPVRSIYEDIVKKEPKYSAAKKLYDEVVSNGKEVSKSEAIKLKEEGVVTEEKVAEE
jgi:hypothetical protein